MLGDPASRTWLMAALWMLAGGGLLIVPPASTEPVRTTLRDAARPGQELILTVSRQIAVAREEWATLTANREEIHRLQAELETLTEQHRKLLARHLAVQEAGQTGAANDAALLLPQSVAARVLTPDVRAAWAGRTVIGAGDAAGVKPDLLVVESETASVVDHGTESGVQPGDLAYAGRVVVGRIETTGRWTSTLMPVTDSQFHRLGKILRGGEQGWDTGAEGIVQGDGEAHLLLKGIPFTEPVDVGDEVFTAGDDAVFSQPMYFGRIVSAELTPGALEWEIRIEPAAKPDQLRTVHVLRSQLNPLRVIAN